VANLIELDPGFSHVWRWAANVTPGIYRITVYWHSEVRKLGFFPLRTATQRIAGQRELARKIQVLSQPSTGGY
jgi:hypothetical protein